jgi:hypothetical protein
MYRYVNKVGLCAAMIFALLSIACPPRKQSPADKTNPRPMTQKDINAVLKDHDRELLNIPGVVGVYVGLLPDEKTPCLKVMVVKETEDIKRKIPKVLESYSVVIEESGVIRPLNDKAH